MASSLQDDFRHFASELRLQLHAAQGSLNEFTDYCAAEELTVSKEAISTVSVLLNRSKALIARIEDRLEAGPRKRDWASWATAVEMELRTAAQTVAFARLVLSWRSPSRAQSISAQFFDLKAQQADEMNYERYGYRNIQRIEQQLLDVTGLSDAEFAATWVSSGMAAFALIESYLLRNRTGSGDVFLLAPYLYFEIGEQLAALSHLTARRMTSFDADAIIKEIQSFRPKAVFIDPLENRVDQRMIDIPRILRNFSNCDSGPVFVIDGSMLPLALCASIGDFRPVHNIFYFESASKYLQFGMDISMGGVVVHDLRLKPQMDRLRRNGGLVPTELGSAVFPNYDRSRLMNRIERMESNAALLAKEFAGKKGLCEVVKVIHPSLCDHPDHRLHARWGRGGACVTLSLRIPKGTDGRSLMEFFLSIVLAEAGRAGLALTNGTSFGFNVTRVGLATGDGVMPFLRVAVGDYLSEQNKAFASIFDNAARQVLEQLDVRPRRKKSQVAR